MINRRKFIIQAGLISGITLSAKFSYSKSKNVAGLQLYTLREQLLKDVKDVIAKVAEAGYKEVEVFGYDKTEGFWGLSPVEFKALLDKSGLVSPSGHYSMEEFLESGKFDDLDNAITTAKILGHTYIVLPHVNEKFRKTRKDISSLVDKLNLAAGYIKKAGLKMAYHNHASEFIPIEGVMLYKELLEGTTSELIDFEMDLYWVVRAGYDPESFFKKYPGRFTMVHVKDMDMQDNKLNTEVGTGVLNFKRIFSNAQLAGIKHYIIEQENFKIDPYVSIIKSCRYLTEELLR